MLRPEETFVPCVIEKRVQMPVKARHIQQAKGLLMPAQLAPRQDLKEFLERAVAARQRDEPIGQFRHQRLALMHRFHHAQVGQFLVNDFLDDKFLGNHADDVPAV